MGDRTRQRTAANLYNTAAYTTVINNTLHEALGELYSLVEVFEGLPEDVRQQVSEALRNISDAQVAIFGTYELAASRYEVLCGKQGASGVADPDLLSAYIDPPPAYSAAGRQAFTHQRKWAIRQAASQAGRHSTKPRGGGTGTSSQTQSRFGTQPGRGRGRKKPNAAGHGKGRDRSVKRGNQ